jgi:hypothetical protein
MREIKFRAFDKENKRMVYDITVCNGDGGCFPVNGDWDDIINPENEERCILMQYTGLKDKNGKDIYDGDILKHRQGVDAVRWRDDGWALGNWQPDGLSGFCSDTYDEDDEFPEIIGNIYENKELLKPLD